VLDSVFSGSISYAALLTMAAYTVIFGFIAIRYFRWEQPSPRTRLPRCGSG